MSETTLLADQIRRSYAGPAWHGPALLDVLAGVTAAIAGRRLAGSHTIWEIVLHVSVWQQAATRALAGEPMPPDDFADDWRPPRTTDKEWTEDLADLERSSRDLVCAVAAMNESRLRDTVPGREYTFHFLLHGVPQHNTYHAGQISLLKKI